jgi:hypothetical protein
MSPRANVRRRSEGVIPVFNPPYLSGIMAGETSIQFSAIISAQ